MVSMDPLVPRHVYLFRHGIAIAREDPACPPDPERRLTEKGARRTAAAVRGLARLGVLATRVWSSPYLRAMETAELVRSGLEIDDAVEVFHHIEPGGDHVETARALEGGVLIAGHAPHLDFLVEHLTGAHVRMKKAGCACVDLDEERLVWLLEPRALRALG